MHTRNKLNVKQVEGLKKPGIYSDGGGLYLRIRDAGTRSWLYVWTIQGKRREMGLGSALDVSLARARERAAEARNHCLEGRDPIAQKAKPAAIAAPIVTFGECAMRTVSEIEDGFRNAKHRQQWRSTLITYAAPLFALPIDEVTTEHVVAVLKPIWLSKAETASRVRSRIERVLDGAKAIGLRDGENPARTKGHLDLLLPKRRPSVKHHAALAHRDMPVFMADLRARSAPAARALEFTILTAARSGETRGMTWGEIDFEERVWIIPGDRMKAGKEHYVPLSLAALNVLALVRPTEPKDSRLVFPAARGGALSDMAMAQLLKRMERHGITVHGFRSAFRDWSGDVTEFGREEIEFALAHAVGSKSEQAYRRDSALDKRRALMTAWSEYCNGEKTEPT